MDKKFTDWLLHDCSSRITSKKGNIVHQWVLNKDAENSWGGVDCDSVNGYSTNEIWKIYCDTIKGA